MKRKYLPGLCDGTLIGAHGGTEPEAGSDIFSMRTLFRKDGDHYTLDGVKIGFYILNGPPEPRRNRITGNTFIDVPIHVDNASGEPDLIADP